MHEPVLLDTVVSLLAPRAGGVYVDGTVGFGGHAGAILAAGGGRVIGLDRDPAAIALARDRLAPYADRVELVHADYRDLGALLAARGLDRVDGVLVDLGVSSMQIDDASRGFSFRHDGPLDMRMDPSAGEPASVWLARVDEPTLADVIYRYGEDRHARRIARAIVRARSRQPIETTGALAAVVRRAAGGGRWQRIDPATRTFQAIRIWINRELDGLEEFLVQAAAALAGGGRLVAIAFHSLEDRIVKHTFRRLAADQTVRLLTPKPIGPGDEEAARNPRARSARLRAVERLV